MGVWGFEAGDITDTKDLESRPIYRTPDIEDFLRFEKSQVRIISGLKGTGKTLFLKLISHHHRSKGVTCVPKTELTERLYSIDYDFSGERAKAWASHERWKHVWRTVLSVIALKSIGKDIPDKLLEIFPDNLGLSIGSHLSAAIKNRAVNLQQFQQLFPEILDSAIQRIAQPVALFVDNIDEALARHSGYDLYRDFKYPQAQSGAHSYGLWLSAQIGFILAVRELTFRNAHLKLYGTVRTEAIRDNPTATAFNAQAMILDLRYNPTELRGIFETKLRQLLETSPMSFPRRSEHDPIKAFLPSDTIPHKSVRDICGNPLNEDCFDYLKRHTRGRPRELDFIGHELQMIPPEDRTLEKIREVVRDLSHRFYGYAKNEAVPFWNPELDKLLDKIPSNFISKARAHRITDKLFGKENSEALWCALYANGLCGAVVSEHPRGLIQRFANHNGVAELSEMDFKSSRIWIIHPCVTIATRPRKIRYQPHATSVAGHACTFIAEPKTPRKHIHVLIGAGRLGLGLVVPMVLASDQTNILIVNRASDKWRQLCLPNGEMPDKGTLHITYLSRAGLKPTGYSLSIRVVTDLKETWQQELRSRARRSRCVLFLWSTKESLKYATVLGDSIGISVGSAGLKEVAENISETVFNNKLILGYENDEQEMQKASTLLHNKFVPTVVDRICIERAINSETIDIIAEPYGSITAFVNSEKQSRLPPVFLHNESQQVRAVTTATEFEFIREKKKRLVNSLHAAAAALVQTALMDAGASLATASDRILGVVAGNMEISAQLVRVKELLILAVIGTLPADQITQSSLPHLIRDLNDYGKEALNRMLEYPDSPLRVLRNDVSLLASKYSRLFSDIKALALTALRNKDVQSAISLSENEITVRLAVLSEAFLRLVSKASGTK